MCIINFYLLTGDSSNDHGKNESVRQESQANNADQIISENISRILNRANNAD